MEKMVFLKEARDGLALALEAISTQAHLKAMTDLNTTVIGFDAVVKEFSKERLGIALVPSEKQTHPQLTAHKFYVLCIVDNPARKTILQKLDLIAAPINGEYPIFIFDEETQPYPLGEKMALETRLLAHCCAGPLPPMISNLK
jgi:hypothetical protein